ncbi:MAG: Fatty acyl-CoA reductase [Actinomycetota bacterium]
MKSRQFDPTSTALEVVTGIALTGRRAVVTGAASGIGVETARALAQAGAAVTVTARDLEAAQAAADDITASTGSRLVSAARLDLLDLEGVRGFTDSWTGPLDILVNNAGVMATPELYTEAGWELQFATNHMGHFALTLGLHAALALADHARVVVVSSSGHGNSPVVFDDLFFDRRPYDPDLAYGQSKTANVLFAVELTRRWRDDGITANALMPGGIWTQLQRHWDPQVLEQMKQQTADLSTAETSVNKTPEQGAATSTFLATAPELQGIGGRYYEDCHEADVVEEITDQVHGVCEYALDPDSARRLWDVSLDLLRKAGREVD